MLRPSTRAIINNSGIDWLTCTAPNDGRDLSLLLRADGILQEERDAGHEEERLRWQQYDLKQCGGVSAGRREDGSIVRLSGPTAQRHWWKVVPYARNVSRLDAQVTVKTEYPNTPLGALHLREIVKWRKGRERAPKISFVGGPDGIECVYVGSRTSETFGRVYNKEAETGEAEWRGCWRYEVETKKSVATRLARVLYHESDPELACQLFVHEWFSQRGIGCAFAPGQGRVRAAAERARTNDERRLKWLRDQVDPVVFALVDNGHAEELLTGMASLRRLMDERSALAKRQETSNVSE